MSSDLARLIQVTKKQSFFLFGARGTGKSTFLKTACFPPDAPPALWIDLLQASEEDSLAAHPDSLLARVSHLQPGQWIVIDEIQKVPKLLDLVHHLIEARKLCFALSGSSARKLKREGANLLAGRAFVYHLHPFSCLELGARFDLQEALTWGSLPRLLALEDGADKNLFLRSYTSTYVREEIQIEQIVRNLPVFRRFLEVAAQTNGQPLNYSKLAREIHTDHGTVRSYYEVLEDTLLGIHLPHHETSIRRQIRRSPKFYLFDPGVKRALSKSLEIPLQEGTYEYGRAFEHFLILEFHKLVSYRGKDESLSYVLTKDGLEIDLVIERPGKATLYVEIKSSPLVHAQDCSGLQRWMADAGDARGILLSRDPNRKTFGLVEAHPWRAFLEAFAKDEIP